MQPVDHGKAAHDPPTVAHILKLLGTTIESADGQLSLTEPARKPVRVQNVKSFDYRQCTDASEYLGCMRFGAGGRPEGAVYVLTCCDMLDSFLDVDQVQAPKQGQSIESGIQEARIGLAPLITREGAIDWVLKLCDD